MSEWRKALCALALAGAALAGPLLPREAAAQADDLPSAFGRSFYADHKASRPGDILTVLVVEESSASESAQASTSKSDGLSASLSTPSRMGRQWQGSVGDQFSGGGQIERSGQLVATLSVVVDRVDRNGNLWVRGDQDIKINGDRQRIRLTGMVRPDDIGPDNTVPSWRVSHARLALIGKGSLVGNEKPGLLIRILHWLRLD